MLAEGIPGFFGLLVFPNPKIMQYRIFTVDLRTSKFTSTLEIPKLSNVIFFKRVAKHIFALDTTGTIIYASVDLSRFQSRKAYGRYLAVRKARC